MTVRSRKFDNGDTRGDLPSDEVAPGAISIRNVSKRFRRQTNRKKSYATLKSELLSFLRGSSQSEDEGTWTVAVEKLNLEIPSGSSLGILGRNGSGKSSLLKLIAGIYKPDEGEIVVGGRISALIELGAGFHPDFTGRENVYLGGIVYGLTKAQVRERFDDIVRYAALEDCIDDPVRTYSSGMYMRLGFSLAVHTDPDILLVDEVLSVGDAAFIHRCHDTLREFRRRGKTLILVSHDLPSITRWCDHVTWFAEGVLKAEGPPRKIIQQYLKDVEQDQARDVEERNKNLKRIRDTPRQTLDEARDNRGGDVHRWGDGLVEIVDVVLSDGTKSSCSVFHPEDLLEARIRYRINGPVTDVVFGMGLVRGDGIEMIGSNTDIDAVEVPLPSNESTPSYPLEGSCVITLPRLGLAEGSYYLDVATHRSDGIPYDYHHRLYSFAVRSEENTTGMVSPERVWRFSPEYESKELPSVRSHVVGV